MKPLSRPFAAILAGMLLDAHAFRRAIPQGRCGWSFLSPPAEP